MQFNNAFSESMTRRTDAELVEITTKQRADFLPDALIAAEQEIKNRNFTPEYLSQVKAGLQQKYDAIKARVYEPLGDGSKILYAIFPHKGYAMAAFYKRNGYLKKSDDASTWATIGGLAYIGIVFLIILIHWISKHINS